MGVSLPSSSSLSSARSAARGLNRCPAFSVPPWPCGLAPLYPTPGLILRSAGGPSPRAFVEPLGTHALLPKDSKVRDAGPELLGLHPGGRGQGHLLQTKASRHRTPRTTETRVPCHWNCRIQRPLKTLWGGFFTCNEEKIETKTKPQTQSPQGSEPLQLKELPFTSPVSRWFLPQPNSPIRGPAGGPTAPSPAPRPGAGLNLRHRMLSSAYLVVKVCLISSRFSLPVTGLCRTGAVRFSWGSRSNPRRRPVAGATRTSSL